MAETTPYSLVDLLQDRWQPLAARVGERRAALLQTIEEKTAQRAFTPGEQATRFANLCMALGPGFETRSENEWALAILIDDGLDPWVKLHQLVMQAADALRRRGGDGEALAQRLLDNDQAVLDRFDKPAPRPGSRLRQRQAVRLRRTACDLEAAEIRLLDTGFRQEYRLKEGHWTRVAVDAPSPVRIDAQHPAPERVTVLTRVEGEEAPLRLQVRTIYHAKCGLGLHGEVIWIGGRSREQFHDEASRAPSWAVSVPVEADGPRLLQEAWHDIGMLQVNSCGLRDAGRPMGHAHVQVWAYWARQSLLTLERTETKLGFTLPDAKSSPPAVKPTRVVLERDGDKLPTEAWQRGFDESLRPALAQGLQRLLDAWKVHVQDASLQAEIGLFDGKAAMTWGLREGPRGLQSPPVQRVVADLDWSASADVHLQGMVEFAGAKAHLHLRIEGVARLQTQIERLHGDVDLLAAMQGAVLRWRWPVQIDCDPVAHDEGIVFSEVGPSTGALTGTLGLRPTVTGGGGWEWFATLTLDPVASRVVVHDPLLGRSESHMALLGSVSLLDWSLN
jgi:hypothetical protein